MAGLFLAAAFIIRKFPLEPSHHTATPHGATLEDPFAGHHVIAKDEARIRLIGIHADTHALCLTSLFLGLSIVKDSGSQGSAGSIQASCHHRRSLGQPGLGCRLSRHPSHHCITGHNRGEKAFRNTQLAAHIQIPDPLPHIKAMPAITLADILGESTRQAIYQVTIGLKNLINPAIDLRQGLLIPDHLGSGISGLQRIPGQVENGLRPYLLF